MQNLKIIIEISDLDTLLLIKDVGISAFFDEKLREIGIKADKVSFRRPSSGRDVVSGLPQFVETEEVSRGG